MSQEIAFTPVQRFWRLLQPDHKDVRNVYIYAAFNGLVALSLPLGIQAIVNLIQGGQVNTSWIILVSFVVLGIAVTGVLQIVQLRITENLQQRIFTRAAFEFSFRLPRVKMEALYNHYAPELMNRFFDTIVVQKGLSKILIDFSVASLQVVFGLVLLSFYHPFFIIFGVILVLLVLAIFRFTARKGMTTSLKESKYKYDVAHWLEEMARTNATFKLSGRTDLPLEKTNRHVGDYLEARESHFKVLIQQNYLLVTFKVLVATGLLAIGGILVMQQKMNVGQFIAAEIVILLVMSSVEKLILSLENIYDVLTALEKIGQVTDLELEKEEGMDCSGDGPIAVDIQDVEFTYPKGNKQILNKVNLSLEPGEKLIITGSNGSGKSTLLQVLAGLYEIIQGSITYNGLPLGNINLTSLRSVIGESLTQELLFEGTLLENITMGRPHASFENVQWAVKELGLVEFIKSLPSGYNTVLDPQGKKLPRSVTNKLILARSIVDNPRLLLLEDTLEHIDADERLRLIDFLTSSERPWTMIAASTDQYFASKADKVAIMEDGQIIEIGTYKSLKDKIKKYSYA
jgi:ABC-type bacteriocin/lantibiotic exporter with double-glycine peptidase domain